MPRKFGKYFELLWILKTIPDFILPHRCLISKKHREYQTTVITQGFWQYKGPSIDRIVQRSTRKFKKNRKGVLCDLFHHIWMCFMGRRQILWYKSSVKQLMSFNHQQIIKMCFYQIYHLKLNTSCLPYLFDVFYNYGGYQNILV